MLLTGFVCAYAPESAVGRIRSCPDNYEYVFLLADNPNLSGPLSSITSDWETSALCPGVPGVIWCTFMPGPETPSRAHNAQPLHAAAGAMRVAAVTPRVPPPTKGSTLPTLHAAGAPAVARPLAASPPPTMPIPTVWGAAQIVPTPGMHPPTVSSAGAGNQCSVLFTNFTIHLEAKDPSRASMGVRLRLPYAGEVGKTQTKNLLRGYLHKSARTKVDLALQLGAVSKTITLSAGKAVDDNFTQEIAAGFVATSRALYDVRINIRAARPAKSSDPVIVTLDSLDIEAT